MSNGDDVLDDWEEIDEATLASTLQKIQADRKSEQEQQHQQIVTSSAGTGIHFLTDSYATGAATPATMKLLQRAATAPTSSSSAAATVAQSGSSAAKSSLDDMAATFQMVLHKPADEYQGANYQPAISSQTVKILRRPTQSSEQRGNGMKVRQPIKTLQQREQEYAEARLRILGAAKNPEDEAAAASAANFSTTASTTTPTTTTHTQTTIITSPIAKVNSASLLNSTKIQGVSNNGGGQQQTAFYQQQQNYYYQQQQQQQQTPAYSNRAQQQQKQPQQTWSPIVGGSVSSPTLRQTQQKQFQQQQQQLQQQQFNQLQQDIVLRMPRGPDGSNGFQMRR